MNANEWTAIHDHQPPGPKTLTVQGTFMLPTPGYTNVHLEPAKPQGSTFPHDYILEVHADPPSGVVPQIPTPYEVTYREETDTENETVSIRPDGPLGIRVDHPE